MSPLSCFQVKIARLLPQLGSVQTLEPANQSHAGDGPCRQGVAVEVGSRTFASTVQRGNRHKRGDRTAQRHPLAERHDVLLFPADYLAPPRYSTALAQSLSSRTPPTRNLAPHPSAAGERPPWSPSGTHIAG